MSKPQQVPAHPLPSRAPARKQRRTPDTGIELYNAVAAENSVHLLGRYSSSFGAASRLLPREKRDPIAAIYALVRVADEIVDGPGQSAGLSTHECAATLDDLERETEHAMDTGFSSNLVVHAFAQTARWAGFGTELTRPFFASMRTDLARSVHDRESIAEYIFGSAEVIGLMCTAVFCADTPVDPARPEIVASARALGAAFQKINFLRDLGDDLEARGRNYFPGVNVALLTARDRDAIIADINADLALARAGIRHLPRPSRAAVLCATDLFTALTAKMAAVDPRDLLRTRIRVTTPRKIGIALSAVLATRVGSARTGTTDISTAPTHHTGE
ncbi:phytoene/squalene synthase family protein [Mycetocola tolaasinivorans]|uniref:phytoene/squalene synthase family protein n=1 Tax=Mycetocola tolaasinivorans TaxID=76635 RepID=UPI00160409D8|nr:phytoene/squalene synthase family protein [Mycetocola tolaasinivorans]